MLVHHIEGAPEAIGPYSHATQIGNLLFCSGQTPIDPETGKLADASVGEQTERALNNLALVLNGLGASLDDVLKTTVFLTDMAHFTEMNKAYESVFDQHTPARTTVAVRELPLGALVEIECIAEVKTS